MNKNEIEASKINLDQLFQKFWFRIPEYQRSYVWGDEQIDELFDDLVYAMKNPEKEYFLGSVVLQKHLKQENGIQYECSDVMDGQQRLTTLFLLMACLRDISDMPQLQSKATSAIQQEEDIFSNQPQRVRMEFLIRDQVGDFVQKVICEKGGTNNKEQVLSFAKGDNLSLRNMTMAIKYIRQHLRELDENGLLTLFAVFLLQKVIVIYVASDNMEDAFRLFTILNNRGIPLTTGDILKSMNIGEIASEKQRQKAATWWESLEAELGRDVFERFLAHVRTILVKDKARDNLLKEYEAIYEKGLLRKGEETLGLMKAYYDVYSKYLLNDNHDQPQLHNLITVLDHTLATDWIPAFLAFALKFNEQELLPFLQRLESKCAADWILRGTPTARLQSTYQILKAIEKAAQPEDIIGNDDIFSYNRNALKSELDGDIYGLRHARYILLKLESLLIDNSQCFPPIRKISIEHVLPRKPAVDSEWMHDFSEEERDQWLNKLGNLVILSRTKNSKFGNREFDDKKACYFHSSLASYFNVQTVMKEEAWTSDVLKTRQVRYTNLLLDHFK